VEDYTYALNLLDDYDHQRVVLADTTNRKIKAVTYDEAVKTISHLRGQFGASVLFGREKDESLRGSLANIFKHLKEKNSIQAWKRKQRICYISL